MQIDLNRHVSQLSEIADGEVQTDRLLAPYTSYNIGGPTAVWVAPTTESGVGRVLKLIHGNKLPFFILGRGSNLLISDNGWDGVTLYLAENLSGFSFEKNLAKVLAGTLLMNLIRAATEKGLGGMELLAGIPGGIGGALRMNAGAFGQEIEGITESVSGFEFDGTPFEVNRDRINFGYRQVPELNKVVITSARFNFETAAAATLRARVADILALRNKKQPLEHPSCGSVFKRPAGYYAGALIEEAGLKGERIGGAMISPKHAGFILNTDNAKAADVYALIRRIEARVLDRFGVRLEREVKLIGEFD
ncbi:UDP-N-acetylenolpyruvoylglucosamine reductase (EC [Olavius sp. associated proteobacterium Delta 1]|nr:UDP-N-acetylenolpyruvoylglucosamine reductase (EC [Olavius sp. associated proteobacterium Delta 1]